MKHKKNTRLIILEGIDGSGKTFYTERLKEALEKQYPTFKIGVFHEPGSTDLGMQIRSLVLDPTNNLSKEQVLFLFATGFEQTIRTIEQSDYDFVILDRSVLSTIVYQQSNNRSFYDIKEELVRHGLKLLSKFEHHCFILTVDPQLALKRQNSRSSNKDRFTADLKKSRERAHLYDIMPELLEIYDHEPTSIIEIDVNDSSITKVENNIELILSIVERGSTNLDFNNKYKVFNHMVKTGNLKILADHLKYMHDHFYGHNLCSEHVPLSNAKDWVDLATAFFMYKGEPCKRVEHITSIYMKTISNKPSVTPHIKYVLDYIVNQFDSYIKFYLEKLNENN